MTSTWPQESSVVEQQGTIQRGIWCVCVYDYPLHNLRKQKDSICQGLDEVITQDTVHMHAVSMAAPNKQCVRVVTLPRQKRGRKQLGRKAGKS